MMLIGVEGEGRVRGGGGLEMGVGSTVLEWAEITSFVEG